MFEELDEYTQKGLLSIVFDYHKPPAEIVWSEPRMVDLLYLTQNFNIVDQCRAVRCATDARDSDVLRYLLRKFRYKFIYPTLHSSGLEDVIRESGLYEK
jgi:hypothetical protein